MEKLLQVTGVTLSSLYTGEVREEEKRASRVNFPVRKTSTGKVVIQFKGALRGTLEKLLASRGEKVCDTGRSKARPCGNCVLCSLFGTMGRKGRATVDFLVSEQDVKQIVRQATHTRLDRNQGSVSDSFTAEEVIENTTFSAKILIHNVQPKDMELIKTALTEIEKEGIGGWTNKGYGRIKFEVQELGART